MERKEKRNGAFFHLSVPQWAPASLPYVPSSFRCNPDNGGRFFAGGGNQDSCQPCARLVCSAPFGHYERNEQPAIKRSLPPPFPDSPIRPDPPTAERSPDCLSVPPPSIRTAPPRSAVDFSKLDTLIKTAKRRGGFMHVLQVGRGRGGEQ